MAGITIPDSQKASTPRAPGTASNGVFRLALDVPQVCLAEAGAASRGERELAGLALPCVEDYSLGQREILDEGAGGVVIKSKWKGGDRVVLKVLKKVLTHVTATSTTTKSLSTTSMLMETSSRSAPTTSKASPVLQPVGSPAKTTRTSTSLLSSSVTTTSMSRLSTSMNGMVLGTSPESPMTLEMPAPLGSSPTLQGLSSQVSAYPFNALNEYLIMKKVESVHIAPAYALLVDNAAVCASADHDESDSSSTVDASNFLDEMPTLCLLMDCYPHSDLLSILTSLRRLSIPLPPGVLDEMFLELAQGVAFLHSRNVAHRDLKPENVLVDSAGRLRICDFGYAVDLDRLEEYPTGELGWWGRGTGSFKAPEVVLGGVKELPLTVESASQLLASDIWSLAVVYYQLRFMAKPWSLAAADDPDYAWYAGVCTRGLCELKSGFEVKQRLAGASTGCSGGSLSRAASVRSSQSSRATRTRSSSSARRSRGELTDQLLSLPDSTLSTLVSMLAPAWSARPTAREVVRSEWLRNVRLAREDRSPSATAPPALTHLLRILISAQRSAKLST